MKVAISFLIGAIVCALMLIGARTVLPIQAESSVTEDSITDNVTLSLLNLLPDIEKIYRESLTFPFQKAKAKIYDPDIAEFYNELLDVTGLNEEMEPEPEL